MALSSLAQREAPIPIFSMANNDSDVLTTGVLLLAGGAAGYAVGSRIVARWLDGKEPTPSAPALPAPGLATSSPPSPPTQMPTAPTAQSPASSPSSAPTTAAPTQRPPASSPPTIMTGPPVRVPQSPVSKSPAITTNPPVPVQRSPSSSPQFDGRPSSSAPRVDVAYPPPRIEKLAGSPDQSARTPARAEKPAPTEAKRAPARVDGPITSPSQLDRQPAPARVDKPITAPSQDRQRAPARVDGPITAPSQLDHQRAPERIGGPVTAPSQLDATRIATHGGPPPGAHPIDPYGPSASAKPIDPHGPPLAATPIDPYGGQKPSAGLPRRFDAVFDRYRGEIPIEYLRALVDRESNFDPKQRTGSAIGLMQIIPVVLDDYNTRNGTHYKRDHLVDPSINVAIGCELLVIIMASYAGNHPHVPNLQTDWRNPRFVELLTFGWNAGFSEAGGVGRVARYLEHHGITDLTIDLVSQRAAAAGASKHLSNAAKVRWCKNVAALYARERALSDPRRATPHA